MKAPARPAACRTVRGFEPEIRQESLKWLFLAGWHASCFITPVTRATQDGKPVDD